MCYVPQKRHRRRLLKGAFASNGYDFIPGNRVTLLHNGEAYFPALEAAIDSARHTLYLETYIYENDVAGRRIADALERAVSRGVDVYALLDGYGSKDLPQSMLNRLRANGVKALIYRPEIFPWTFQRKRLWRMHRKIVVVDREIAFVGGINIVADKQTADDLSPRFDYAVAVEGPLVNVIRLSAQRQWSKAAWTCFLKRTARGKTIPVSSFTGGTTRAAFW